VLRLISLNFSILGTRVGVIEPDGVDKSAIELSSLSVAIEKSPVATFGIAGFFTF